MRKALCILLLLALLPSLAGCWDASEVSGGIFAVNAALDVGEGAALRLTLLFPQVTATGREPTKGEEEQQKNGYGVSTVEGDTLADCLTQMHMVTPRRMSLQQLRGLYLSQDLAKDDALLRSCIDGLSDSRSVRSTAQVYIARGKAEDVLREQMPLFGARLSKSQSAQNDALQELGVIPTVTLSAFARQLDEGSAIAALTAVNSGELSALSASQGAQATARLAGDLPRRTVDKVDLCGSVLLRQGEPLLLNGYETQLYNILTGHLRKLQLTLGTETAVVHIRRTPDITVDTAQDKTLITVTLPLRIEEADAGKFAARLQQDTAALLLKLQAAGADPIGIRDHAKMTVQDLAQWEQLDWAARYPTAVWKIECT